MGQTMAQYCEARGEARGRAEGRAQGLRDALQAFLAGRFGALPPEVAAVIAAADRDRLQAWVDAAATAESLDEVGIPSENGSA